jgi:hypothetical protein
MGNLLSGPRGKPPWKPSGRRLATPAMPPAKLKSEKADRVLFDLSRASFREGPRVRIHLPPPVRWYGAGGEEMAPSSRKLTDGVP